MNKRAKGGTLAMLALLASTCVCSIALGNDYPSRAISVIVPFPAGGGTDVIARLLTQRLAERLKQSVVLENRPGAVGVIGANSVVRSQPDGHTLLFSPHTPITIAGYFTGSRKAPYDPMRDLRPIALVCYVPVVLLARPSFPARHLAELVRLARQSPGKFTYGASGIGNEMHLSWEAVQAASEMSILSVSYQGTGPAMRDTIAGHVDMFMTAVSTVKGLLDDGALRGLAVFAPQRLEQFPNIPTVRESGFPDLQVPSAWFGLFAPSNTPDPIINRLYQEIAQIHKDPDYRNKLSALGIVPALLSPDEFSKVIREDHAQWENVLKTSKITLD